MRSHPPDSGGEKVSLGVARTFPPRWHVPQEAEVVTTGAVAGRCSPRADGCATSPAFPQRKDLGSFPVGAEKNHI